MFSNNAYWAWISNFISDWFSPFVHWAAFRVGLQAEEWILQTLHSASLGELVKKLGVFLMAGAVAQQEPPWS